MNLLFINDKKGQYPNSWYHATARPISPMPALKGDIRADVCVVGGGFTGLSSALHLAQMGYQVVLLEGQRVGFGASGRNGGQVGHGHNIDQRSLEKKLGRADARMLWDIADASITLTRELAEKHAPDAHFKPGHGAAYFSGSETDAARKDRDYLARYYGFDQSEYLDKAATAEIIGTDQYSGMVLDHKGGHLHPLNLALGLARAALAAGVRLFETSCVNQIIEGKTASETSLVKTAEGSVRADYVVLACNGYSSAGNAKVSRRVMPLNNYLVATEPLGEDAAKILTRDICVYDSLFVLNYYRLSHDNRLIFGGGESYGAKFPADIAAKVRKPMLKLFPQLNEVRIDYAWGGTLGITTNRMPYFGRVAPNILNASGYSGHGVALATLAGDIIAQAIHGQSARFDVMARVPTLPFPGGRFLSQPILGLAMSWFALRDRLGL
ncbi:MAG: FAD-dependent oxidoreductase [Rhodobacterales bacterium]|nr:MAG: FAD-dependent oxidoreductase [Rhodobacterales bacterium]